MYTAIKLYTIFRCRKVFRERGVAARFEQPSCIAVTATALLLLVVVAAVVVVELRASASGSLAWLSARLPRVGVRLLAAGLLCSASVVAFVARLARGSLFFCGQL